MAIFKRMRDIISASINDLLDGLEDPELMVNQMIKEMEKSIAELRKNAAASIAVQKVMTAKLAKAANEQKSWLENAELAVKQGNDTLAKKALQKKRQLTGIAGALESEVAQQDRAVRHIKDELRLLEEKVQEARLKRETLITKRRAAETKKRLIQSIENADKHLRARSSRGDKILEGFEGVRLLEDSIEKTFAEAEARRELLLESRSEQIGRKFAELKESKDVDEELRALKKKMR